MIKILLLGAEGCSEVKDFPYVREATGDESGEFYASHPGIGAVDRNGRPYFLMTVILDHPECPEILRERLTNGNVVRTVRLD